MELAFAIILTLIALNSGATEAPRTKVQPQEIYLNSARAPITKVEAMRILILEPKSEVLKCWAVRMTDRGQITKK